MAGAGVGGGAGSGGGGGGGQSVAVGAPGTALGAGVRSTATTNGKSWLAAAAAPPRRPAKAGHVLHRSFHFSYVRRSFEKNRAESYEQQIRNIATVTTVEEFWQVYVHLNRVSKLAPLTDYFLFQEGVRPMWEDEANRRGGRLTVRVHKGVSPRAFEDLCLAVIGEQFDTDDICGIACSVRVADNSLSIWLRDAADRELVGRVEGTARRLLQLPAKSVLRDWSFKAHQVENNVPT